MNCAGCGCSETDPCVFGDGTTCYWAAPYLCSGCAEPDIIGEGERVLEVPPDAFGFDARKDV
jgi:hypothetical protein